MTLQLLGFWRGSYYKRIILAFCVAFTALIFPPGHQVAGQETPTSKPVVSLVSVAPSPMVREGERLRITVAIAPKGKAGSKIEGGVLVFDSWNDAQNGLIVDELIAFVFRGDVETRDMSYRVPDDKALTADRTIRVEINRLFPDYQVDEEDEQSWKTTVNVIDNDVANPATGMPTISGMVQIGQRLRADTGDINDTDGLTNVMYRYQWLRVSSGGSETDIAGATNDYYDVTAADAGSRLKVRVTFTDDAGNPESLESEPTEAIPGPTATPTWTPSPAATPLPSATPTRTPRPRPTRTRRPTATATPTPTPTSTLTATRTSTSTATPAPSPAPPIDAGPKVTPSDLERPTIPIIGDAVPRIRNTLSGIASTPRQRITLVIILGVVCVLVLGAFVYLILRRR